VTTLKKFFIPFFILTLSRFAEADTGNGDISLEEELKFLAAERHVVVTASKQEEHVSKTVATTSVITQNDILQIGARNLLDVLRLVPGIGITETMIGVREIEVRGVKSLASEKVLFMLNGHPLDHNLTNAGSTWVYDDIPISNISRVEVVRGPGSALYGANAFMAVINIITMDAKDMDGFKASTAWGSFDTQQYNAAWGKQFSNKAEAAINFNYTTTNGINTPVPQDILGTSGLAPGNSQLYEQHYDLEWKLGFQGFKLDGRFINKPSGVFVGAANALGPESKKNEEDYFLRLARTWDITDKFNITTQVFHDHFVFDNTFQIVPNYFQRSGITGVRNGGEIQGNYSLSDHQNLISGFSYSEDIQGDEISQTGASINQLSDAIPWVKNFTRKRWGIYAQDVWDPFSSLRLTAGARYDRYNDFGGTFNPRMGFNWEFIKNYSVKSSYGTAYRAPSFGEMGLENNPILGGSATLQPELASTFEGGLIGHPTTNLMTQVTYYNTNITQIIAAAPGVNSVPQNSYSNAGSMRSEGVELESRYDFSGQLQGSYISSNVVYQRTIQEKLQVFDVPKVRANLMMNWAYNRQWSVYGHMLVKDSTTRVSGDVRSDVPAYALFDLSLLGRQFLDKKLDVSFAINNLFDKQVYDPSPCTACSPGYYQVSDYQQQGRSFFGRLNFKY
jgi:iron complex outermembrane receptor protein